MLIALQVGVLKNIMSKAATIIIIGITLKTIVLYSFSVASDRDIYESKNVSTFAWYSFSN